MTDTPLVELLGEAEPAKVEEVQPEPEVKAEPEAETPTEQPETEEQQPEEAKAEEPEATKPEAPEPQPEPKSVPLAALQEERSKRQRIEQELERRIKEAEEARAKEPEPDFFEDPTGALQRFEKKMEERSIQDRINISEEMVIGAVGKEKYDTALSAFAESVAENPALAAQMRSSPNPAKFAYDFGNKSLLMKEMGDDPQAYRDKLKAEIMAELKATEPTPQALTSPPSLAGTKSESGLKTPTWSGPQPLEDLLPS